MATTTREQTGRAAIDDLCNILTVLDEADRNRPNLAELNMIRQIREIIGGPADRTPPSLWRRVLDLSE